MTDLQGWTNTVTRLEQVHPRCEEVGANPKSNNGSRAERPRWAD